MNWKRAATQAGFAITAAALVLQIVLTVEHRLGNGDSLVGALVYYFSFFTILSNIMVALIYLSDLVAWRWLEWWRTPWVRGMMAAAIVLVMIVVHFLLFGLADINIWFVIADRTLHYVDPVMYALWWLLFQRHGALVWGDLPKMLVYPLLYVIWAMTRGAVVNEYPYPFLAANRLGYPQVIVNGAVILAGFVLLYVIVIGVDRWLGRRALRAV
ncbi:Pr6Pr family membrane protein [Devosia sp. CN2-171]|uniref:Pr6Pr family membrane protein n=1 Tax=Devosia sp. CN2-171 TaxID=3400909 RepID=UPI003BF78312